MALPSSSPSHWSMRTPKGWWLGWLQLRAGLWCTQTPSCIAGAHRKGLAYTLNCCWYFRPVCLNQTGRLHWELFQTVGSTLPLLFSSSAGATQKNPLRFKRGYKWDACDVAAPARQGSSLCERNFIAALLMGTSLCGFVANPAPWPRDMILLPMLWGHHLIKYCTA